MTEANVILLVVAICAGIRFSGEILHVVVAVFVVPTAAQLRETWKLFEKIWK